MKLGKLIRYRWADVDVFMAELDTLPLPIAPDLVYEGIVLHDQDQKQKSENCMAMKYQKGTVYLCGQKVKMWYGKYLIYGQDQEGKEVRRHRNVDLPQGRELRNGRPSSCCGR